MILAVASGKGGTGKTSVCASLARVWPQPLAVVDLDVEEPNLHLMLRPTIRGRHQAFMEVPRADEELCIACGLCSELCQFKAIALLGETLISFPEMCHGCGGCLAVCPSGALTPDRRLLGEVIAGAAGELAFYGGRLRVGEAMSPPLMRAVMGRVEADGAPERGDLVIDAPPGASCPAVTAVSWADAIVLVTEPTPFGLYDLRLAWQAFQPTEKPMAVVVNRAGLGDQAVYAFCQEKNLPIICEIPHRREIAEAYARGVPAVEAVPGMAGLFTDLARRAKALAAGHSPRGEEAAHA